MTLRKTERTARKRHRCCFCEGWVEPGDRYIDGFWIFEGEPTPWKAHGECQDIADRYTDGENGVPPFRDWAPEDLEALTARQRATVNRLVAMS